MSTLYFEFICEKMGKWKAVSTGDEQFICCGIHDVEFIHYIRTCF